MDRETKRRRRSCGGGGEEAELQMEPTPPAIYYVPAAGRHGEFLFNRVPACEVACAEPPGCINPLVAWHGRFIALHVCAVVEWCRKRGWVDG